MIHIYVKFWLFTKRFGQNFLPCHFFFFFQERYFSCYMLLTDQICLIWPKKSDCLYSLRYWIMCVLQLLTFQSVTSQILKLTIVFLSSHFPTLPKTLVQNFKYPENKKNIWHEMKSIFNHFERNSTEADKTDFFGRWQSDLKHDLIKNFRLQNYKTSFWHYQTVVWAKES